MRRLLCLLLLLPILLPPSAVEAADDDEKPYIRWSHPWMPRRYFDYRHARWKHIKESGLGVLMEDATERFSYDPDGGREHHQSFTMRVRDPEWLPEFWHVVNKSPLRETEILELDITWEAAGKTRVYSQADLVEYTQAPFDDYITDDVGLWLPLDRSGPGTLKVSVTTKDAPHPGFEHYIGGLELLQPGPYTKSRTLIIEVPQSETLHFASRFFKLRDMPDPVAVGTSNRYTFGFETLYQRLTEHSMPHPMDSFPSLAWSNQPSWEHLSALVSAQWEPELSSTAEMTTWAAELVSGHDGVGQRALAIHDAVASDWDYLGFYPSASGWVPHSADHCYSARIGDCKDKTALMVSLMRAVGIDASPAVVVGGTPYELTEVPTLGFNHAIVSVTDPEHPNGQFFLDSTDAGIGSRPVGAWLQDRDALVLRPEGGGLVHIPPTPAERWLEEDETVITLDQDGTALASVTWRFAGHRANQQVAQRGQTDPERWARQVRRSILSAWPGAEILGLQERADPDDPLDAWLVTAQVRSEHLASRAGPHVVIRPPWLHRRAPGRLAVDAGRRVHPVVLGPLFQRSTVRVQLPAGATVVALPEAFDEQRDDWQGTLTSSADVAGEVQVVLEIREIPGRMDAGLEEARRNFARSVEAAQERPVIVRMGG
jgi:transglutaminase-like putative cysteine protease